MEKKFVPEKKVKYLYYRTQAYFKYIIEKLLPPAKIDYKNIPVIINNFNRVDTLSKLISSLEKRGYFNIYIIDNNSTYPPLLRFYEECRYHVFRLDRNIGTLALWKSGIYKKFRNNFFVYTDSDLVPIDECPDDFMLLFLETLKKYRFAQKVGFSLVLDDIPDCNLMKDHILACEEHFFHDHIKDNILYRAPIGGTFALYRPRGKYRHANNHIEMYRTGYPYMVRHLPWYQDTLNPDEEERYYIGHAGPRTWWTKKSREFLEHEGKLNSGSEIPNSK